MTLARRLHATASLDSGMSKISPFGSVRDRFIAGRMGMYIFIISLAMLFIASLAGYAVLRLQLDWPRNLPHLPRILLLSTLVLALSSGSLHAAWMAIRRNLQQRSARWMAVTAALGLVFLVLQAIAWGSWFQAVGSVWPESQTYRWALTSFYVLTGIHALHVVGGVVPMLIVTVNALRGSYSPENYSGIHYCAMYWHFLGVVWIMLYATLLIGT